MSTFTKVLDRWLTVTTAAAIIVMMLHIVAHALARSIFHAPIYGTNEIVEYWYLPIVALLGIPAAQLQKEHITVTMAIERAKPATAAVFTVFACILGALVSAAFAWFGLTKALENTAIAGIASVSVKEPSSSCTLVASADSGRYAVRSLEETSSTRPKYGPPMPAATTHPRISRANSSTRSRRRGRDGPDGSRRCVGAEPEDGPSAAFMGPPWVVGGLVSLPQLVSLARYPAGATAARHTLVTMPA